MRPSSSSRRSIFESKEPDEVVAAFWPKRSTPTSWSAVGPEAGPLTMPLASNCSTPRNRLPRCPVPPRPTEMREALDDLCRTERIGAAIADLTFVLDHGRVTDGTLARASGTRAPNRCAGLGQRHRRFGDDVAGLVAPRGRRCGCCLRRPRRGCAGWPRATVRASHEHRVRCAASVPLHPTSARCPRRRSRPARANL